MALMDNLIASWNFDNLSKSSGLGTLNISDVQNNNFGTGEGFLPNSNDFLQKEYLKTNRKVLPDTLEGSETIQLLEDDDRKIDTFHKPSSVQLILENSMYQIISDDMLNMFSTIESYSYLFLEPSNKYKTSYKNLDDARRDFFSKILEKPSIEKYIEFYKWIDSSLSYMLEQLQPESCNNIKGLKNTVESHILERSKHRHQLPLTIDSNRIFDKNIQIINSNSLIKSTRSNNKKKSDVKYVTDTIPKENENIYNLENKTSKKNYEIFQSPGKSLNNKENKKTESIFQNRFSSGDGFSDKFRNEFEEYSIYNCLTYRNKKTIIEFNKQQSLPINTQGQNTETNFEDNNYIVRNIPYTGSNYTGPHENYIRIPPEDIQFRKYTNIILDYNQKTYETSRDIVEPPVEFCVNAVNKLIVSTGLETIQINSPYSAFIDNFSYRNTIKYDNFLSSIYDFDIGDRYRYTFLHKAMELMDKKYLDIKHSSKTDVIFPRPDLIGLARSRLKTRYEEEPGYFQSKSLTTALYSRFSELKIQPWSVNSYNNCSAYTRMFWRDDQEQRLRLRGIDTSETDFNYGTGSYNCYNYPNIMQDIISLEDLYFDPNCYNSIYSMDSKYRSPYKEIVVGFNTKIILFSSPMVYGDLTPNNHLHQYTLNINPEKFIENDIKIYPQPKPQFVHNLFLSKYSIKNLKGLDLSIGGSQPKLEYIYNVSYQTNLNCNIKPSYDTYNDFREDMRHKTQDKSIIPEFIGCNFKGLITSPSDYITEYGCTEYSRA